MTKESPGRDQQPPNVTRTEDAQALVPTRATGPQPPGGMSEKEVQRAQREACELVERLGDVGGGKELELLDGITNVGLQSQRNAARQLDPLKDRLSTFLNEENTGQGIATGLRELHETLDQINPEGLRKSSVWARALCAIPIIGSHYNPVVRALHKVALRYEPVSRQLVAIEAKLRDGRALLARDNIELRKLYEDIEKQQLSVQESAYLAELVILSLTELLARTDHPAKRDRLEGAMHDVALRAQDLRTMEEVHVQYLVSIEISRQNNNRLGQSIERTLSMASNVVTVGLAIQCALIRQKRVIEATRRTREFLGELVLANATAVRQHTREIGDLYSDPIIAAEKISQAHDELVEALKSASQLRQEGIAAARDNIARLNQLSGALVQSVSGLPEEGQSPPDKEEVLQR